MINLIFSFVFTTAKTNLFYARLQKAAAIKAENIRAVRHLEIFLGQTFHFIDKKPLRLDWGRDPRNSSDVGWAGSSWLYLLPRLNLLVYFKAGIFWLSSSLFKCLPHHTPPNANSCWEGLGFQSLFPHLPRWYLSLFYPVLSLWLSWLPNLDLYPAGLFSVISFYLIN